MGQWFKVYVADQDCHGDSGSVFTLRIRTGLPWRQWFNVHIADRDGHVGGDTFAMMAMMAGWRMVAEN